VGKQAKTDLEAILNNPPNAAGKPQAIKQRIKSALWQNVGLLRSEKGLLAALREIGQIQDEHVPNLFARSYRELREAVEAENMVLVAEMVTRSALMRQESRGAHYRLDRPYRDDGKWLKNIFLSGGADGMLLRKEPIKLLKVKPQKVSKFGVEVRG
jgi:succinate dehydrogenase/fumarate reductase flavoprotein subunit